MKALVFPGPNEALRCLDVPIPSVEPDQVLVKVRSAGICGTDLHFYQNDEVAKRKKLRYPYILGHEMAGEVVEVGRDVTRFAVGDRITTETHVPCGKCFFCQNDKQHVCIYLESFAQKIGGVFAEYCRVPEYCGRKLPEGVDYRLGSMFEPLGVAVRAALESGCAGDSVLVTGCGPIGLMAIAACRALGASLLFATDRVAERLQMAARMGADYVLDADDHDTEDSILRATKGLGPGSLIEASGASSAFCMGLRLLRVGGKAVIFGLGTRRAEVDVARFIVSKEATIVGILGRRMFDTWWKMESFMQQKAFNLAPVIGESFPLERFEEAFSLALSGKTGKIFFDP